MVTIKDAFVDAWRSHRIEQGDDPAALPDPLGVQRAKRVGEKKTERRQKKQKATGALSTAAESESGGGGFLVEDVDGSGDEQRAEGVSSSGQGMGAGGFLVEDSNEDGRPGGFLVDDDDNEQEQDVQWQDEEPSARAKYLPVSSIPDALTNLSLPSNDETVLKLFRDVAVLEDETQESQGTGEAGRRRRRGVGVGPASKVVTLADFERIASVLVAGQQQQRARREDSDGGDDGAMNASSSRHRRPRRAAAASSLKRLRAPEMRDDDDELDLEDSDEEDTFKINEDEGDVAEDDGRDEDDFRPRPTRRKRTTVSAPSRSTVRGKATSRSISGGLRRTHRSIAATDDEEEDDDDGDTSEDLNDSDDAHRTDDEDLDTRLTAHQRSQVYAAFSLLTERLALLRDRGGNKASAIPQNDQRIGKDDLRALVHAVGEKIPEKEIDEMIDIGQQYFAAASSPDVTRQSARLRRDALAGRAAAADLSGGRPTTKEETIGIDEFAGILLKGRVI